MKYLILHKLLLLVIIVLLMNCAGENHYYKKAFSKTGKHLNEGDTLIFPFKGKYLDRQYHKGNLRVTQTNKKKLQFDQVGLWLEYDPSDENKILNRYEFDSSGFFNYSKLYGTDYGYDSLINKVVCEDTMVNDKKMRLCSYTWFHKNGMVSDTYNTLWKGKTAKGDLLHGMVRKYDINGILISENKYYLNKKIK